MSVTRVRRVEGNLPLDLTVESIDVVYDDLDDVRVVGR
jgi:hypothetical protein